MRGPGPSPRPLSNAVFARREKKPMSRLRAPAPARRLFALSLALLLAAALLAPVGTGLPGLVAGMDSTSALAAPAGEPAAAPAPVSARQMTDTLVIALDQ